MRRAEPSSADGMLREWLAAAADLFLGSSCLGCGAPGLGLCPDCCGYIDAMTPISRSVGYDGPHGRATLPVRAVAAYEGFIEDLVIAHKDRGAMWLAAPMGERIGRLAPRRSDLLWCPVPSQPSAVRARGYDHGRALARAAARVHAGTCTPLLVRARASGDQVGRSRSERLASQDRSMRVTQHDLCATPVLIVDDVVTTGATLGEAARALSHGGFRPVGAVCFAATSDDHKHRKALDASG